MYNVADFSFLLDIVDNLTDNLCNSVKGPGTCGFTLERARRGTVDLFYVENAPASTT